MKISDAVVKSFMGDGIVTARDEQGLYAKYNRIEYVIGGSEVKLIFGETVVSEMHLPGAIGVGDTLHIHGIDGRLRIEFD